MSEFPTAFLLTVLTYGAVGVTAAWWLLALGYIIRRKKLIEPDSPPMDWTAIRATHRRRDPYEHDIRG